MDFEIRHESARLLKPVVNAAARTLKHAQIELGPGGMRIWGNDQTNVAGIDVEIPADAFDTYDVEAGTFQTNIDAWGDAFRGTRKTDPVAVYTEPNDYDSLRDVAAIGSNTKRVLREKDLDSIEALESAAPEDLVGETDYKSRDETKTAEIDMEKAEEIVFEVNGSHVVIESDGERQIEGDASDHPRVRYPTLSFSVPGREIEATATVNGKDFSKAYRAVASVTESAFLGATEGAFLLYGEGDTDRVHASPDADVNGSEAGGLYNAEWLSTLRLSLDRKASTDLTFHLPVVDDGGERNGKHILWADFAIRDADVEWFMAPKIMGAASDDDDPETEADRLERIAPSNYDPTDDVRWDVETTGGDAKAWLSVMDSKSDEARVHLEPDGLTSRFVEPANVMMQDVQIGKGAFESYTWRQPAGRLYDQDRVIGLPQHRVVDYLKLFTKTEELRFQVDAKAQFAIIGDNFTATMPTIDPDSVRREPDLPGLDLPGSVTVDAESFIDAVDACDDVADHVGVVMYDGECYIHADGDLDTAWEAVETVAGEGYASSLFSAEYLTDYLGSIPSGATETITLYGGREFPMFAEHDVAHPDADFTLMLAPRIQDDSNGVYGSDAIKEHGMDPLRIKDADPIYTVGDDGHVVRDEAGESLPQTPEEAAEQVRDDDEGDDDPYDPTAEFNEDYGPTMDTPIPASEREMMAGVQGTGIAPSDLTRRQHVTLDDTTVHRDDVEDPDVDEEFAAAVAGIYDPSQDLEGDADEFRASFHHSAGVPEEIGDWTLKTQVEEGRPVYTKDGRELRVNRSFSTDVVHRRYYVELREAEENDVGVRPRETLADGLSPEEAMDVLEEEALERSGGDTYQPDEEDGDLVEVRSPFRPIPREANKALWDEYDAVDDLEATDDAGRGQGVLLPERPPQDFLDKYELEVVRDPLVTYDSSSGVVEVYTDPDKVTVGSTETSMDPAEAVEQAEQQPENFTLKSGDPTDVPGYDGTDDEGGVYDPTDEFEEMEEPSEISGIGEGRRKTLDALDEKATLDDPQSFDTLEEMKNAVREISLAHRDGRTYMAPPEKALNAIQTTWDALPEEARDEFLNDHRLYVKIRAARNRFNDWMGKKRREQEIPSTMEAGPSNYPSKKAKKTAQYARDGKEELDEAIDKIRSAANGAKQRALQAIGSSVGEQNEQERQEKREERRDTFEKGDLAFWSDTVYGNALWGVKRVNKKSVRLRRPHSSAGMEVPMSDGETYPEYDETRADLDSSRLEGPVPAEEVAKFDADDAGVRAPEDYIPARVDTADEARIAVFGEEWARKNLDLGSDDGTPAEDQPWLDELKGIGSATYDDLVALGLSNIGDAKEAYRNRANSDTWRKALNAAPSKQGRESLLEAVGADPEATVAEDMEKAEETATEDLADELRDRGVNNVVAHNLAEQYDTLQAVQDAAAGAADVTDLQGVGDASALQVRRALDLEPEQDDTDDGDTPTTDPDPDPTPTTGDREKAEEHRKAVKAARDADPDGDLPGPALAALKKNWSVYKRGIKEGREAVEEATEYRDEHRGEAEEAAAIINDIRAAYGQDPIDFDGVDGVPEVAELGGPITAESSGVSLAFDWKADPYDPEEDV